MYHTVNCCFKSISLCNSLMETSTSSTNQMKHDQRGKDNGLIFYNNVHYVYFSLLIYNRCQWKIEVPDGYYVHIYLHEVLSRDQSSKCQTGVNGLLFTAFSTCGQHFPTYPICDSSGQSSLITACSDLVIMMMVPREKNAMRFWLSYHGRCYCFFKMIRYDTIRYSTMCYDAKQYDSIRYYAVLSWCVILEFFRGLLNNTTQCNMQRHDTIRYDSMKYDTKQNDMI